MTYASCRTLIGRLAALSLAVSAACGAVGCKNKEETKATSEKAEGKKKKPRGDRYADGQRLAGAQKEWAKRWSETLDLPACDPLLKAPADQEVCKTAQAALTTLKTAVAKPEPEAVLVRAAAELAFASEAASEKLRTAFMEKSQAEHKAGPVPSGAPSAKPPAQSVKPVGSAFSSLRARPAGSADKSAFLDKLKGGQKELEAQSTDPDQQLLQAYARVGRASLRYLGQFLQYGPLPTRNATFTELEALGKRKETWPALARALREAAMTENDQALQAKLKALVPKLARRTPSSAPAAAPSAAPEPSAKP